MASAGLASASLIPNAAAPLPGRTLRSPVPIGGLRREDGEASLNCYRPKLPRETAQEIYVRWYGVSKDMYGGLHSSNFLWRYSSRRQVSARVPTRQAEARATRLRITVRLQHEPAL